MSKFDLLDHEVKCCEDAQEENIISEEKYAWIEKIISKEGEYFDAVVKRVIV